MFTVDFFWQGNRLWTLRSGEVEVGEGLKKNTLHFGYNVHYSHDGCTKTSDFTTIQSIHITKNHVYS